MLGYELNGKELHGEQCIPQQKVDNHLPKRKSIDS